MYSASRVLRAWSRHPSLLAGQAAVRAAEACGLVQLGAVAAAAAVAYVQDLRRRQDWLQRTAAERKQATMSEAAGHVDRQVCEALLRRSLQGQWDATLPLEHLMHLSSGNSRPC